MENWLIAVILSVFILVFCFGWYFSNKILLPKTYSREFAYQHELEQGKIYLPVYDCLPHEEIIIHSPYGYALNGYFFPQEGTNTTIIISHGITWNLNGSIKYMEMFYKHGYSILLYDLRNHGINQKTNTTFGYYEKHDLVRCIDWVKKKLGPGETIGLMGESLGAGISLQAAAIDPRVSFVVADCPFSDLTRLLETRALADYHLPARVTIRLVDWFIKFRAGFHIRQVSPILDLQEVSTPILFAHGENDTYIPPAMSMEMYRQRPESRQLYLAPGAGHAQAYWNNREEYTTIVDNFIAGIDLARKTVQEAS